MKNRIYSGKIVFQASQLKIIYNTDDPFEIATKLGIEVKIVDENIKVLKACTDYIDNKPFIKINSQYTTMSQRVLCAHELGHIILHQGVKHEYKNNYSGYYDLDAEFEANMFAVALVFPPTSFIRPIAYMPAAYLQLLIDINIQMKNK